MNTPLKEARLRRGLSQKAIAEAIGMDHTHYSNVERGRTGASPELAAKLAKFFGHEVTEMQILYPERYMTDEDKESA